MTLDQIRNILHGAKPFTVRKVSGREYRVEHPDFAALARDFTTLVLTDEKKLFELIRLSQIGSINVVDEPAA